MESNYTKASLERFLQTAEKQGFFNANTLAGMRSCVLSLMEDMESDFDVRKVDVEASTIRYRNKHPGDLSPGTLQTYGARLKRLITEFVRYNENPAGYKPYARPVKANSERGAKAAKSKRVEVMRAVEDKSNDVTDFVPLESLTRTTPTAMSMQYPLREDFIAQVLLPRGMTSDEARRLCAFIQTLAVDFTPGK